MFEPYSNEVEERMRIFFDSLSEKDRRRYAAIEALKLPYGGKSYVSEILDCDIKTIQRGISDLNNSEEIKKNE